MANSERRRIDNQVDRGILAVSLVSTFLGLGLLASGNPLGVAALLFGAVGFVHLKGELPERTTSTEPDPQHEPDSRQIDDPEDALTVIRDRYARGEIDQAKFERLLDDLVETETLEDATAYRDANVASERS